LPGNSFTAGSVRLSSARFGSARHGTEKTPLRLRLRNRGACFNVTILTCRVVCVMEITGSSLDDCIY
jgi:hypothetical protein